MSIVLSPNRSTRYDAKRDGLGAIPAKVKQAVEVCRAQHQQLQRYTTLGVNAYKHAYWVGLER